MKTRRQEVWAEVKFADGTTRSGPVEGTNMGNLRSRIAGWIDKVLISYSVDAGAVFTIRIATALPDEFARPDPE